MTVSAGKTEEISDESLSFLRASAQEWQATAYVNHAQLGERYIVLDKHERAFSQLHVGGEAQVKLELAKPSLEGVSFMTAANAEKARGELEVMMPHFAPYVAWDFQTYAQVKANEAMLRIKQLVEKRWAADRVSSTLADAKELAGLVIESLGLVVHEWRQSGSADTPWEVADVDVGEGAKMSVGASYGGVVSIDGKPFTPGDPNLSKLNVKFGEVEESMQHRVGVLTQARILSDEQRMLIQELEEKAAKLRQNDVADEGQVLVDTTAETMEL